MVLPKSSKSKYTLLSPYLATTAPALHIFKIAHTNNNYTFRHILRSKVPISNQEKVKSDLEEVGLKLVREGLKVSLVPARELPPRPLMVVVAAGAQVVRDAIVAKIRAQSNDFTKL